MIMIKKKDIAQNYSFNSNKVSTFDDYYVSSVGVDNQWFAIIDDNISEDIYKKYQICHPMLLCRPSQPQYELAKNCFMSISTMTNGFDGVLESFNTYINFIKDLSPEQILETQRNMITHLSCGELIAKIRKRNYAFIERYFTEGHADDADYKDTLNCIAYTYSDPTPSKIELVQLQNILEIISKKFESSNNKEIVEKIRKLQRDFNEL